jgi:tripartite-type tricarboxylate transporter receptor subunit TctC
MTRGIAFKVPLIALALLVTSTAALAQDAPWAPKKPVELITMSSAGSTSNAATQVMVEIIKKYQLAPVTVTLVNKPGGMGSEAFAYFLNAPDPDHVLLTNSKTFYILELRHPELHVDIGLFTPIALMGVDSFMLWVHGDLLNINTMDDFAKAVREKKEKTGQDWIMAGTGVDSEDSLLTALINDKYRLEIKYLPCSGGGEVSRLLLEKKADSTLNYAGDLLESSRNHQVKPVVTFSNHRLPEYPDTPTLIELGDNFSHDMPRLFAGPPKMSPEAQAFYARLFHKIFLTPEWKAYREQKILSGKFMTGPALTDYWLEQLHSRRTLLSVEDIFDAVNHHTASAGHATTVAEHHPAAKAVKAKKAEKAGKAGTPEKK